MFFLFLKITSENTINNQTGKIDENCNSLNKQTTYKIHQVPF